MYKFIYFSLADTLLVFSYSVEGQQIALRSLLIIPSFMFLGWHDTARMAGCHFKITTTVADTVISIWRHLFWSFCSESVLQVLEIKYRNMQWAITERHRSTRTFAHIYLPLAPSVIKTALPAVDTPDMEVCSLSLSLTFFLFVSSSFISPPCHQSLSPSIPQSGRLSSFLNILKLMYLTQRSALSLSVSHSVCLPSAFPAVFHHLSFWNWFTGCNVANLVLAE